MDDQEYPGRIAEPEDADDAVPARLILDVGHKVFRINERRPQSYTVILTNEESPRIPIVFVYEEVLEQN